MYVRQRLSSEPDRYRGRRRVPTPPRSRYAVVGAAAFVGAGVVAIGAASNLPDVKDVDPSVMAGLQTARVPAADLESRTEDAERANRSAERGSEEQASTLSAEEAAEQAWMLPLSDYTFTSGYGLRGEKNLHAGIDLAAVEGTPFKAIRGGTVTQAGYYGGYGFAVTIKTDDNVEMIYAHSRRVLVNKGDTVKTGQVIGLVGNSGASYGTHLHIETHVDGEPTDPIPLLRDHGVDIKLKIESVYGNLAAS
jgi:murein DD-endopeptidase MepM/ murein hydrolase activator NlpD